MTVVEQQVHELTISAIAFPEGNSWVVQGIEYDIVAHASDAAAIPEALMRALVENACISQHLGRELMGGIPAAPPHFRDMFERAATTIGSVRHADTPIPVGNMDIRLAAHAV